MLVLEVWSASARDTGQQPSCICGWLPACRLPSIPAPMQSADLEQLLAAHQGDMLTQPTMGTSPFSGMSRFGSLGIGKLESMELPGEQVGDGSCVLCLRHHDSDTSALGPWAYRLQPVPCTC